jgi:NADH-quinone oxidoreductase subunit M
MAFPILSLLIATPILGALLITVFTRENAAGYHAARVVAMLITSVTFVLSLLALSQFDVSNADFQLVEMVPWFREYNITYHLGVDGISLAMILLTTLLMPFCILCSMESITVRVREYMIAFLLLEALVIGVFSSLDLLLFYLFFEAVLIPMYILIGVWGGEKRVYAAYKFFLYTLAGSVLFLIAVLYFYFTFGTMDIPTLMEQAPTLGLSVQQWLWLALFASFAVKVPMWPFHTWLPDAHVQAPTAGSVILAGILLKMGAYGFLRFSLPMLPEASHYFTPLMAVLSVIAVIYTSLVALVQEDMKKLIAYSSVAHMGYVTLGIFSFTKQGIDGAIFQMISHGLVSGALFLCVGVLYDRMHTKSIAAYGGVANVMPHFAFVFMLFTMASVGLPATSGFVGELLVLVGAFQTLQWAAILAASGLILGAAYMLWLYRRVMYGAVANHEVEQLRDLSSREWLILAPLMVLVLLIGIYPKPVLSLIHAPVARVLEQTDLTKLHAAAAAIAAAEEREQGEDDAANDDGVENKANESGHQHKADKPNYNHGDGAGIDAAKIHKTLPSAKSDSSVSDHKTTVKGVE